MKLRRVNELQPQVESTLETALTRLHAVLPDVETHHVGATAIPGAATKGDVDLVVRVTSTQFPLVVRSLGTLFETKQAENWTDEFASFGDDDGFELPLGIQVVVRGSELDIFLYLRDYLRAHDDAREEYDRIKIEHASDMADGYCEAKNAFLERILATRDTDETTYQAVRADRPPGCARVQPQLSRQLNCTSFGGETPRAADSGIDVDPS